MAKAEAAHWPSLKRVVVDFPRCGGSGDCESRTSDGTPEARRTDAPRDQDRHSIARHDGSAAGARQEPAFRLLDLAGGSRTPSMRATSDVHTLLGDMHLIRPDLRMFSRAPQVR